MFRRTVSELKRIDVRLKIFVQPSRLNNNEKKSYEASHIPDTDFLNFADQFLSLIRMILILFLSFQSLSTLKQNVGSHERRVFAPTVFLYANSLFMNQVQ